MGRFSSGLELSLGHPGRDLCIAGPAADSKDTQTGSGLAAHRIGNSLLVTSHYHYEILFVLLSNFKIIYY